jgi:hypothetical protein
VFGRSELYPSHPFAMGGKETSDLDSGMTCAISEAATMLRRCLAALQTPRKALMHMNAVCAASSVLHVSGVLG